MKTIVLALVLLLAAPVVADPPAKMLVRVESIRLVVPYRVPGPVMPPPGAPVPAPHPLAGQSVMAVKLTDGSIHYSKSSYDSILSQLNAALRDRKAFIELLDCPEMQDYSPWLYQMPVGVPQIIAPQK